MRKILVGIDGSEGSNRAAVVTAMMATKFGSTVTLLYVASSVSDSPRYSGKPTYIQSGEIMYGEKLDFAKKVLEEKNVGYEIVVEMGDPADKILQRSHDDFGMIVLGTKGNSSIRDTLLGRVSTKVIKASEIPVMVVP